MTYNFKPGDRVIYVGCTESCVGQLGHITSSKRHIGKKFIVRSTFEGRAHLLDDNGLIPYLSHLKPFHEAYVNGIDLCGP